MLYEIYFEPRGNVWRIRITTYFFLFFSFSRVVQESVKSADEPTRTLCPLNFKTFQDADRHVKAVGLDNMYMRRRRDGGAIWANGEAAHAAG